MMLPIVLVALLSVGSSKRVYNGPLEPLCQLKNITPKSVLQKSMFLGTVQMGWSWRRLIPDTDCVAIIVSGPYPHHYRRHVFQVRDKHGKPFGTFGRDLDVCLVDCPPGRKNTAYYVKNRQTDLMAVWFPPEDHKPNDTAVLHLSAYLDDNRYWTESFVVPKRDALALAIDAIPRKGSRRRR